jgi:hypothetical protein
MATNGAQPFRKGSLRLKRSEATTDISRIVGSFAGTTRPTRFDSNCVSFGGNPHAARIAGYLDFPAFLLAQIIFNLAESLALAAALILPLAFRAGFTDDFPALTFAHLALAAALILALPAALIFRFFLGTARAAGLAEEPNSWPSSFSSD